MVDEVEAVGEIEVSWLADVVAAELCDRLCVHEELDEKGCDAERVAPCEGVSVPEIDDDSEPGWTDRVEDCVLVEA